MNLPEIVRDKLLVKSPSSVEVWGESVLILAECAAECQVTQQAEEELIALLRVVCRVKLGFLKQQHLQDRGRI